MKITDLRGIFNIEPNPNHKDWLNISFKEDFIIPEKNKNYCIEKCLKIELDNEYEEIFFEGANENGVEYLLDFGTIIVDDRERELDMYYTLCDCATEPYKIPANKTHNFVYMAYKLNRDKEIKRHGDIVIISNKDKIKSIEENVEFPSNEKFLKVKIDG